MALDLVDKKLLPETRKNNDIMLPEKMKKVVLFILLILAIAVVQGQQANMTEEDIIEKAQSLFDQEKWQEALEYYGISLGMTAHPASLLQNILRISGELADYTQAIEITEDLTEKFPDHGQIW